MESNNDIKTIFERIFEPHKPKRKFKCDNCKDYVTELEEYIGRSHGREYWAFLCKECFDKKIENS